MTYRIRKGAVCRHHSGKVYTVLEIANTAPSEAFRKPEFPPIVVYVGANGNVWARPYSEFIRKFTVLYDGTNLAEAPSEPT